jgi:UDP-N-acetylmuramyl pentapeptide phosphotransferase/UDP-N-acetylglucosamine-1-phosphate transferase
MREPAIVLALSCATAIAAIALLRLNARRLPQATPNARSLHEGSVPRAGGLAILAGSLVASLLVPPDLPGSVWLWLAAVVAVAAISFADDVRGVSAAWRFAVQFAAALIVAMQLGNTAAAPWATVALALAIVWGANLFNFMDGSDGLAASMAIVGFSAYAAAAAHAGASWLPFAAIAIAVLPFFVANRPRASMFMGDVGAVPLGFLAAALGVAGVLQSAWPWWFPVLVFLPFVADATLTLVARGLRGEPVWRAHRLHFYQRLNALGAGHRGTLAIYGGLMLACAALALACLVLAPRGGTLALAAALAVHLTGFGLIDYHWRKKQAAN